MHPAKESAAIAGTSKIFRRIFCVCIVFKLIGLGRRRICCMKRVARFPQHAKPQPVERKHGVYTGRKSGTTKAAPSRARVLKKQGLKVSEIAAALGVKQRSVYNYLSRR